MTSYPLLEHAPPHDSDEFLDYLANNNKVVFEDNHWLVIENCKYHTAERLWLTAFAKLDNISFEALIKSFGHLEWRKKLPRKQTVKRFHIHMYEV